MKIIKQDRKGARKYWHIYKTNILPLGSNEIVYRTLCGRSVNPNSPDFQEEVDVSNRRIGNLCAKSSGGGKGLCRTCTYAWQSMYS